MLSGTFQALLASILFVNAVSAHAGKYSSQFASAHHRPASLNVAHSSRAGQGLINMGYYENWKVAQYTPSDVPVKEISHILYSFAKTDKVTGAISFSDPVVDAETAYPGDPEGDNVLRGALGQFWKIKQENRHLKMLLSVGGWTYSQDGYFDFIKDSAARAKFVADATTIIEDYGFDGIDVDFEALREDQKADYTSLMTDIRAGLDAYQKEKGDEVPYLLTSAVGVSPNPLFDVAALDKAMDFWNMMDYDMSGSWLNTTEHQANLFSETGGASIDTGVKAWLAAGVAPSKLVMGIPIYGRSFDGTAGIGKPFTAIGANDGTSIYSDLPLAGSEVTEDLKNGFSYSYDAAKQSLVSYDTPGVVGVKADYVVQSGLGGCMYWALSMDKKGDDSLVHTAMGKLGTLDSTSNHVSFPKSKFTNVASAAGDVPPPAGGGEASSTEVPPASTEVPVPPTSTSAPPTPTPTACAAKRRA